MELRQLQCLVVCAQTQAFSKAASLLFTSQSNISKTIASLENELGTKLFIRKQHGIELTEKGKQIYKYALNMIEYSEKIIDCSEEEEAEELRISFQPSSWFATAFCDYYQKAGEDKDKFMVTSASVEEIIRRISTGLDQLGFAYIEEEQLEKLKEVFLTNHIGYYSLHKTKTVLYHGANVEEGEDLLLIQGTEDYYSGIFTRKDRGNEAEESKRPKVVVTTNSDYIMQEMLKRTKLSNISPEYLSHGEKKIQSNTEELGEFEQQIQFVCMFRNDRVMERNPKEFLSFLKKYIREEV